MTSSGLYWNTITTPWLIRLISILRLANVFVCSLCSHPVLRTSYMIDIVKGLYGGLGSTTYIPSFCMEYPWGSHRRLLAEIHRVHLMVHLSKLGWFPAHFSRFRESSWTILYNIRRIDSPTRCRYLEPCDPRIEDCRAVRRWGYFPR